MKSTAPTLISRVKSKYFSPLANLVRSHPLTNPGKRWDEQYQKQEWAYLSHLKEFAHLAVVGGYARYLKPGGDVLDLGCGEGLLVSYLTLDGKAAYVGVDVSEVAVQLASQKHLPHTDFIHANITTYQPEATFDLIIICEALQYIYKPAQLLKRYSRHLKPGGWFILSLYEDQHHSAWDDLKENYLPAMDETRVVNQRGMAWIVKVMPKWEE